jgi:hypothetical protein
MIVDGPPPAVMGEDESYKVAGKRYSFQVRHQRRQGMNKFFFLVPVCIVFGPFFMIGLGVPDAPYWLVIIGVAMLDVGLAIMFGSLMNQQKLIEKLCAKHGSEKGTSLAQG